jgi:hypothetical protein
MPTAIGSSGVLAACSHLAARKVRTVANLYASGLEAEPGLLLPRVPVTVLCSCGLSWRPHAFGHCCATGAAPHLLLPHRPFSQSACTPMRSYQMRPILFKHVHRGQACGQCLSGACQVEPSR